MQLSDRIRPKTFLGKILLMLETFEISKLFSGFQTLFLLLSLNSQIYRTLTRASALRLSL